MFNLYEKELYFSILDKEQEMYGWCENDGYNEEQTELSKELEEFITKNKIKTDPFPVQFYVSCGMYSVARHYGGIEIDGKEFQYIYTLDCLIEKSILREFRKEKRKITKTDPKTLLNETNFIL